MPIIPSGGAAGKPWIRYSPQANAWTMSAVGDLKSGEEFVWSQPAAWDVDGMQIGHIFVTSGQFDWRPWAKRDEPEATPNQNVEWKIGFAMSAYSKTMFGEREPARELCTGSAGVIEFANKLFDAWEAHPEKAENKCPVVNITGSVALKFGQGSTRVPTFEIVKVIDIPGPLLSNRSGVVNRDQGNNTPSAPPPQQPAQGEFGGDEFGGNSSQAQQPSQQASDQAMGSEF